MADYLAVAGQYLDGLLSTLGIHGVNGLDACTYLLWAAVIIGFCAAVRTATRLTMLRCSFRN
jgi:hypothetical protein